MKHKQLLLVFIALIVASLAIVSVACGPKAVFEVSNLTISSTEVVPEQTVMVTAYVENVGGAGGNYTVELKIDEAVADSAEVTVAVGEAEMVTFTFTRASVGTYNLSVDGLNATVTVTEGLLPTLNVGDRWVYTMTSNSHLYTYTSEVTKQQTIDGKECYLLDVSLDPPYAGFMTGGEVWIEKETLWIRKSQMLGEYMGLPWLVSSDCSTEGPPLFPLEVGKEVEVTQTITQTRTMQGTTQTETGSATGTFIVEKIEVITVPAGTFRCFKIVEYDEHGTPVDTGWYSDKVKSIDYVKSIDLETGDTTELVSYSVQ